MAKPKNIEQLRADKERAETQLAQEQHKLEGEVFRQNPQDKFIMIVELSDHGEFDRQFLTSPVPAMLCSHRNP